MAGNLPHLKIDSFFNPKIYVYPKIVAPEFPIAQRNRNIHGNNLLGQLKNIRDQFDIAKEQALPQNIVADDAVYVEFYSEWNLPLKFDSLNQEAENPKHQIINIKKEIVEDADGEKARYKVVVMMKQGSVSEFITKVAKYIVEDTKVSKRPKNEPLVANIASIELATLKSFWSDEPEIPFPDENEVLWWEVWFRRTENDDARIDRVIQNLNTIGALVGQQTMKFPEHIVNLVKGSARQLSGSLILLDNLAELRKPQQINDFITGKNIDLPQKQQWVEDLLQRTEANQGNDVVICLLDSGVNNKHPLIEKFLPDSKLYTYKDGWGTNDSWDSGGHGTGMAGLALYGDLTDALLSPGDIKIYHSLESFKIIHPADPHDPCLYGDVTEFACSTPVVNNPASTRIYCLAITDGELAFKGRPSTWSAAIDRIAFGDIVDPFMPQLFIVSGGNVDYMLPQVNAEDYPDKNLLESIHDPSQSYNALTIGTYTRMDRIDQNVWPDVVPLAAIGAMSPSNSTSLLWENQWPIKPDIVMEGGNLAIQGTQIRDDVHTLKPLSLDKDPNMLFYPFGDTSGAAALGAKMAAELTTAYPQMWPETIRALMVHSADWTEAMLHGIDFTNASGADKRLLLRSYGYGVPSKDKAFYSANNSLTLIAENEIQPYKIDGGSVKYNEYHLYNIPWPEDILRDYLTEKDVKLTITLSYFIDPNPGNKRYATNFHYHSHSLDFKMIKPTEDLNEFKRRISGSEENEETAYQGQDEPWALKEITRSKGSIKKDFIISSGADLSTRNIVAIYPKAGWYKTRKKLIRLAETKVRYSLIMTIETEDQQVDIYTPVMNLIQATLTV